jgi:hypothetical protein
MQRLKEKTKLSKSIPYISKRQNEMKAFAKTVVH